MPDVSVIVPLYNKAAYIDRCLDSILGQSYADFELIVVNDGSTDGGEHAVERRSDRRVRLISQANAGPGEARNHGARLAEGELLAFLDGDDAWHPDYLKESVAQMNGKMSGEAASLTWGMKIFPRGESTERRWREGGIPEGDLSGESRDRRWSDHRDAGEHAALVDGDSESGVPGPGRLLRKYRCVYSEDAWLYLKLLLRYPATFDYRPLTYRFEDASELAVNLRGARPIEPFLQDPESVSADCPAAMQSLLREVLARRALKTATVYGYWGEFQQSRALFKRFVSPGDWRLPYFATGLASCTPLSGWAGGIARAAVRRRGIRN